MSSGLSLYEIRQEIENQLDMIFDSVDTETGEVTISFDTLDCLNIAKAEKVENIACYIKNLDAEVEAYKTEEDRLRKRRQALENKANRLRKYLADNLEITDKYDTPRCRVSFRKSTKVSIPDESVIPKKYLKVKTEVDRTTIKSLLKEGKKIKGATLEDNYTLQVG